MMNITELIEICEGIRGMHGDLPVKTGVMFDGNFFETQILDVKVIQADKIKVLGICHGEHAFNDEGTLSGRKQSILQDRIRAR